MKTSLFKLRNEYGITDKVMHMLSAMMTAKKYPFTLEKMGIVVNPIGGKPYIKNSNARVFRIEDAIECVSNKEHRHYTVSVHQNKLDEQVRARALTELNQALETYKEQS